MFKTFNMGIGMVLIVDHQIENDVIELISPLSLAYKIGSVIPGNKEVLIA